MKKIGTITTVVKISKQTITWLPSFVYYNRLNHLSISTDNGSVFDCNVYIPIATRVRDISKL